MEQIAQTKQQNKTEVSGYSVEKNDEIYSEVKQRVEKQILKIEETLTDSFAYNIKIAEKDSVVINNKDRNTDKVKCHNIKVIVDSKKAQAEIKQKAGIDFNAMIMTAEKENPAVAILIKNKLSNVLKKTAKTIL